MSFRARIGAIIFLTGFVPTLIVIGVAAYSISMTLERVASSGLEASLSAAGRLVDDAESVAAELLEGKIASGPRWSSAEEAREWLQENRLDLVFGDYDSTVVIAFSESPTSAGTETAEFPRLKPGVSHLSLGGSEYLVYAIIDSVSITACGVLFPPGYREQGMVLVDGISVAPRLAIIKSLSFKLLLAITLAAVIFSAVAAFVFSGILGRRLVRPLEELMRATDRFGKGDFDHRISLLGGDEFSRLGDSFNNMACRIREHQSRLLETERLAAWREVARRIAHEIKNPLTPIAVQTYRLEQNMESSAASDRQALSIIKDQLQVLQNLAQHFSAFAREPELQKLQGSVADVIKAAADPFRAFPGASISVSIEDDLPALHLDPVMMRMALANIIKNSLEASPGSAVVSIIARRVESGVEVLFKDCGPGFPAEKLSRIDQPYVTSKKTGTGLGLIIIKKIIEEHGGSVEFFNSDGAVTKIILPA
jgi:nitrogen fixation/metabolism regulation signal transduction histidine kinase